jgi:hypothetical protein
MPSARFVAVALLLLSTRCAFLVDGGTFAEPDASEPCVTSPGVAPPPATNLKATIVECSFDGGGVTSVRLTWDAGVPADGGFIVARHISGLNEIAFTEIARVDGATGTYLDADPSITATIAQFPSYRYDYEVIAFDGAGTALPSNPTNAFLNPMRCAEKAFSQSCVDACN